MASSVVQPRTSGILSIFSGEGWKLVLYSGSKARYLFPVALGIALLCLYVVPFHFPPTHPVPSQSYVAGYNNNVAAVLLALISAFVALLSLRVAGTTVPQFERDASVRWPWLALGAVLVALWNGGLSWLVFAAHNYGIEDFYVLPQLEKAYYLHLHLYSQIEFCYGQLLFYPPIWVHWLLTPFHISLRASYYVALLLQHLLGLAMLYFVVNQLPMRRGMRNAAFACIALYSFSPFLGPNYTLFRYMLPIASLILLSWIQQPVAGIVATAVAQTAVWLDSSEQAIGFGFAAVAYWSYTAWRKKTASLLLPVAGLFLGTGLYLGFTDSSFLSTLIAVSKGSNHQVPPFSFTIPVLLIAMVWVVPRMIASHWRRNTPQSGLLVSLYVLGLGLLPATVGSIDLNHISCNAAVIFLLSFVAAAEWRFPPGRALWATMVIATYLLFVIQTALECHFRFYYNLGHVDKQITALAPVLPARLVSYLRSIEKRWAWSEPPLDVKALHALIGNAPFVTPYAMPELVEEKLPEIPNFLPSYWSGTIDLWDATTEQKKIDEIRQVQWALLNVGPYSTPIPPDHIGRYDIPTHRRTVHPMRVNALLENEIKRNWVPTARVGSEGTYILYHRIR